MNKVAQKVYELALPVAREQEIDIWDVEYVREAGQWYLRVYIDREGGVDIAACEKFSRALDPILDEADPIEESYIFEVSSAGAERELRRPSDFEKFIGSPVEVKLYKAEGGAKSFTGTLAAYSDGSVTLAFPSGERVFEKSQIAQVRLRIS